MMHNLLNIFNTIADSNLAYYILVIILLIVVVSMIYLIYSQNKELNNAKELREKQEEEFSNINSNNMESQLTKEEKASEEDEKFSHTMNTPIRYSVLDMIKKDEDLGNTLDDSLDDSVLEMINTDTTKDTVVEEKVKEEKEEDEKEKVKTMVDIELPGMKKMELIDATLTNLPKVSLLEETMTAIPPIMEYDGKKEDLLNITRELENIPRERTVKLTPYEEEQEQTAIISYDELIKSNEGIVYNDIKEDGDLEIKQVDLDKTTELNLNEINKIPRETYAHEELFLSKLKSLQSKIN